MRPTAEQNAQAIREMRETWAWVQPATTTDLLDRLARGRDLAMPTRELENLCAVAHTEIKRLLRLIDERENLLQEFVDDASYTRTIGEAGVRHCGQCGATQKTPHISECVVGKVEALLRHLEA